MELNVKQSGIERRIFTTVFQKSRSDKVNKRVHELYLRNDIPCGLAECKNCKFTDFSALSTIGTDSTSTTAPFRHCLVMDGFSVLKFVDVLNDPAFSSVIIPQSSWNYVKKLNPPIYKRMQTLYVDYSDRFFVFLNEFISETFVDSGINRLPELYQEKCMVKCAKYLQAHWKEIGVCPIIVCADENTKSKLSMNYPNVLTLYEYTMGIRGCEKVAERIKDLFSVENSRGPALYPAHWPQDKLLDGLSSGVLKKGKFQLSMENYMEAYVTFERGEQWFIKGRQNMNRAVHGDVVVARLLPRTEWNCPEKTIRLRDAEEVANNEAEEGSEALADNQLSVDGESQAKRARVEIIPTAEIVGILRRNWRNYCGVILAPHVEGKGERRFLFAPTERLVPRIRVETSHYDQLRGKKLLVQIDSWPQDSHYPKGHYIREIGQEGERTTEEEVILLEHEISHSEFTPAVLECLPRLPWMPEPSDYRTDLTHLDVCSVDPEGCTDIDDALHCVDLGDNRYEVGVHIADVTHFVRPGTAMDLEAAERSTTVYLCGRRIDMLPELLSSNLCSLRENEPRYAFSVVWILKIEQSDDGTSEVNIESSKFMKSLIRSRRAFTYQLAQKQIDNVEEFKDNITTSLRNLLKLSIYLKSKRKVMGALELASTEIRFDIDQQTGMPVRINEKLHLPTMSMIEEFMLLANISVAEKILEGFPDSAVLRRHPVPTEESFKTVVEMARSCNFELNVGTGKELSKSLEIIDMECRGQGITSRSLTGQMLRMLTTRCMTQAVYFAAGTISADQYLHYGLAAKVYTHFTSPIRRYADVMVHRLLANLIGVDALHDSMTDRKRLIRQTDNMNKRHRQAQYASRASVLLNTFLMIKEHPEPKINAIVIGIRNNAIQVTVPKYGLEAYIFFDRKGKNNEEKEEISVSEIIAMVEKKIRLFQSIVVSLEVKEVNQRRIFDLRLLDPSIPGLSCSAVTVCDSEAITE